MLWTIGFLIFILLTEFTFYKLGILEIDKWNHPLYSSIIRIIGSVILAPIVEELIFKGFNFKRPIETRSKYSLCNFYSSLFLCAAT